MENNDSNNIQNTDSNINPAGQAGNDALKNLPDTHLSDKSRHKDRIRRGTILISSPFLTDPNFKRTAILILDTDSQGGHIGLVINRSLDLTLEEVCKLPGKNGKMAIHSGGPVDLQRIFWLHTLGERLKDSIEILPGLFVGGDYDDMISLFVNSDVDIKSDIHLYLGYSGWSKGQLEKEIDAGAWGIVDNLPDPGMLLELDGEELWNQLCMLLGPEHRHWRIIPADPSLN